MAVLVAELVARSGMYGFAAGLRVVGMFEAGFGVIKAGVVQVVMVLVVMVEVGVIIVVGVMVLGKPTEPACGDANWAILIGSEETVIVSSHIACGIS